jgi:hypothetical protein
LWRARHSPLVQEMHPYHQTPLSHLSTLKKQQWDYHGFLSASSVPYLNNERWFPFMQLILR